MTMTKTNVVTKETTPEFQDTLEQMDKEAEASSGFDKNRLKKEQVKPNAAQRQYGTMKPFPRMF